MGEGDLPVTPTFACSSDSSGNIGKRPVHLLQPPARDWGIPGAGPQCECLGSGRGGGPLPIGRGESERPPGLLLNAWEAAFEQNPFLLR